MPEPLISRRTFVSGVAASLSPALLSGCGGGGQTDAVEAPTSGGSPTDPPAIRPRVTSLQATATGAGTFPYSATLLLLRGEVPAGAALVSDDDPDMTHTVFTTWEDGSAALAIVSGRITVTQSEVKTLKVQLERSPTGSRTALTVTDIAKSVSTLSVDFGSGRVAVLSDFTTPDRTWWANSQCICARYRARQTAGGPLEAIVDLHVYATGATFAEVVVENGLVDLVKPVAPLSAVYTSASIRVNGTNLIENVSSTDAIEGEHAAFRAWYASGWIGGNPGLRVTQIHTDLQRHPLFFKMVRESSADLSIYESDQYVPWSTGRHRPKDMGSTGDHPSIGPLPLWEARFLQTGDARAAKAVEASCLSTLTYNINYRNSATGFVPDFGQIGARDQQGSVPAWPRLRHPMSMGTWESAHHPAAGLMAFVVRPSPVFVEIAQKVAVWNGTWSGANNDFTWTSGTHGHWYQVRGRAWCLRSLVHATFLTPADMPWRTHGSNAIYNNAVLFNRWRTDPRAKLNTMWDYLPATGIKDGSIASGFQSSIWMYHFLLPELHKASSLGLLQGEQQSTLTTVTDWACLQPVRWINEQSNGGWRYVPYLTTMGRDAANIDSMDNWGDQMNWFYGNSPPSVTGGWYVFDGTPPTAYNNNNENTRSGAFYPSYLWASLVAAVERDLPGARDAWNTVQRDLTTLSTWLDGFASDPRWGSTPRNL